MPQATTVEQTFGATKTGEALEQLCADTIRTLSMDGVELANSGHPGMPMGMADIAHLLWTEFLQLDPKDPHWPGRDRFVLSNGHGSMLLYSLLHLSGQGLTIDDLKKFRQVDSKTPGHPESFMTSGVETTTGPLGQGFGNAVGMAMVERNLAARYEPGVVGHRTFVFCGDGCLMEGVASEAASLAGHLALGKLVCLWDDNHISIDGSTDLAFTEDVVKRFEAYGWRTTRVDGHDRSQIRRALAEAVAQEEKPTLIACRTIIGKGAPTKQGTEKVHGSALGKEELKKTKEIMGWPLEPTFLVPEVVRTRWAARTAEWARGRAAWDEKLARYQAQKPAEHAAWKLQMSGDLPADLEKKLPVFTTADAQATRAAGGKTLNALYAVIPGLIGGSADLTESNSTHIKEAKDFTKNNYAGRYIHFGVREHGMGSILNGMSLHGGAIPFGATFLVFSDYMRGSIRLAALSHLRVIYVFTHDSIFLGEDGPTHQPVEHMAALRSIPNLVVLRPGDPQETEWSWKIAVERMHGPTALVLTRQKLPVFDRAGADPVASPSHVARGGYTLWESAPATPGAAGRTGAPDLILIGTGSELALAFDAAKVIAKEDNLRVRVVSMPSFELFEQQEESYRRAVLPRIPARVAIEAMRPLGWDRWIGEDGLMIGMSGFGASGSDKQVAEKFGFTLPAVVARVRAHLTELARNRTSK